MEQGRSGADSDRHRCALLRYGEEAYCSPVTSKAALVHRTFVLWLTRTCSSMGEVACSNCRTSSLLRRRISASVDSGKSTSSQSSRHSASRTLHSLFAELNTAIFDRVVEHEIRCDQGGDRQAEADPPVSPDCVEKSRHAARRGDQQAETNELMTHAVLGPHRLRVAGDPGHVQQIVPDSATGCLRHHGLPLPSPPPRIPSVGGKARRRVWMDGSGRAAERTQNVYNYRQLPTF